MRRLGYSEEFIRLWRFYLCYSEAAFEERYIGLMQLQFDKPGRRRDLSAISVPIPQSAPEVPAARPTARRNGAAELATLKLR